MIKAEDDAIPLEVTGSVKVYNQAYVDKQEKRIKDLEQEVKYQTDDCKKWQKMYKNRCKEYLQLEQKLEQTEKDLTDYQFNYPSIEKLSEENGKLLQRIEQLEKDVIENESDCSMCDFPKLKQDLEKENAELTEQHEVSARNMSSFIESLSKSENEAKKQLTKAKEILKEIAESETYFDILEAKNKVIDFLKE